MASKGKVRGELWLRLPAVPQTQPDKTNISEVKLNSPFFILKKHFTDALVWLLLFSRFCVVVCLFLE